MIEISAIERQWLLLCASGRTDDEIARSIGHSVKTVRLCLTSAIVKLKARSRSHAVVTALKAGVVILDELN